MDVGFDLGNSSLMWTIQCICNSGWEIGVGSCGVKGRKGTRRTSGRSVLTVYHDRPKNHSAYGHCGRTTRDMHGKQKGSEQGGGEIFSEKNRIDPESSESGRD